MRNVQEKQLLEQICHQLVVSFHPEEIILFNKKVSTDGSLVSFKLCVILDTDDVLAMEQKIYLALDFDLPYDVLVYTPAEWKQYSVDPGSFASYVNQKGTVLYHG